MTANPKIIFTDLDGTLLTTDKKITPKNIDAIRRMTAAGHKFVIATGRPFLSAKKLCDEYDFNGEGYYIVASNGGVIYDCHTKETILRNQVPFEHVKHIFECAGKEGFHVQTYSDEHVIALRETPEIISYTNTIKMPYKIVERIPEDLEYEPPKVIVISKKGRDVLNEFRHSLSEWAQDKVQCVFSANTLLEFLPPQSTKGNGVIKLCELLNIPISDSIACGDEENDISMIKAAGLGVVMKNGTDTVKAHADYITDCSNDDSGIAEVISKFILG